MKKETISKVTAIALFFAIALVGRYVGLQMECERTVDWQFFFKNWTEGIGPCIGALAVVFLLGRKFYCSVAGSSVIKSIISVAIPFVVCYFMYEELSYVLLGFIFYSLLEEVGWRGYLQGELLDKSPLIQALIIGTMWFVWHINISISVGSLLFWAILVFGAWGIGRIANDTHSLVLCACFHTLFNFSKHGFFEFTPLVIGAYVLVVASWFVIWYTPWGKVFAKKNG